MIVNGVVILTGGAIVALATSSFGADTVGVMGPGSTAGMLMLLGIALVGLGVRGWRKSSQGAITSQGNYLALGMREVNLRGASLFQRIDERRLMMNKDVLKGKWKEIKGGVKVKWGKLTDDVLTQVEENNEKLFGLMQQKYDAKEKAEQEYKDFIGRYKGE